MRRWMVLMGICLMTFAGCGMLQRAEKGTPETNMFYGVRSVSSEKIQALFPDVAGKPLFLEFKSKFCLDCKKMAPLVEELKTIAPAVEFRLLDIGEDKAQYSAVFNAFQPASVPIYLFITPTGTIHQVLYDVQEREVMQANLLAIQTPDAI